MLLSMVYEKPLYARVIFDISVKIGKRQSADKYKNNEYHLVYQSLGKR